MRGLASPHSILGAIETSCSVCARCLRSTRWIPWDMTSGVFSLFSARLARQQSLVRCLGRLKSTGICMVWEKASRVCFCTQRVAGFDSGYMSMRCLRRLSRISHIFNVRMDSGRSSWTVQTVLFMRQSSRQLWRRPPSLCAWLPRIGTTTLVVSCQDAGGFRAYFTCETARSSHFLVDLLGVVVSAVKHQGQFGPCRAFSATQVVLSVGADFGWISRGALMRCMPSTGTHGAVPHGGDCIRVSS